MHPLDIISQSPNLYLFQKQSNKTNFGGFLFLVYLVLIILVLIYYIVEYIRNPTYTIQSFNHFNFKTEKEIKERNNDEIYNPNIEFNITVQNLNDKTYHDISNNFKLFDYTKGKFSDLNSKFNDKINNFDYFIVYECDGFNYSNYIKYTKTFQEDINDFYLYMEYQGFTLEHQDDNEPIKKNDIFVKKYQINLNSSLIITNNWRTIIYTEKKEFLQSNYRDGCGYIENFNSLNYGSFLKLVYRGKNMEKVYAIISEIYFDIDYKQYIEYSRIRVSELDLLANVFSLMANIFTGVRFIFTFYSNNFNNFKIIEKILNKEPTKNYKINKPIEMNDFENNKFISNSEKFLDKENNDNDKHEDTNDKIEEKDDEDNDEDKSSTNSNARIKKLHFFDFFLNNLYFCCKKRKQQKIIHMCNEIVYKYASIDCLIKNQILIENFFKDYKWNDPSLNNIENNNLIIQLKTYL